jgi:hypothetical protein
VWTTRMILAIGLVLATLAGTAGEAEAPHPAKVAEPPLEVLDEVLVTGVQPGPALWQVKSGGNVLWVLVESPRLSKHVKWRSKQVEKVLANTQEVLASYGTQVLPPPTRAELNELAPQLERARYLPDGQTLREVIPSDLYARFKAAIADFPRHKKLEKNEKDIERSRPDRARSILMNRAWMALELGASPAGEKVVDMAKRKRVKLTRVGYLWVSGGPIPVPSIESAMDICRLDELLRDLEGSGGRWKALSNAWAVGDVKRFREFLRPPPRIPECETEKERGQLSFAAVENWLAPMERSLANNRSTLAVVGATLFLSDDGVLDALRRRGYEIVEP